MKEYKDIEKNKEVPQLDSKTFVSQDYSNQINGHVTSFMYQGIDRVKARLKIRPFHMKKYEEVYSGYKNVVNEKNKDRVKKLDELANKMNEILKDSDNIDQNDFCKTCNEIYFLIYGDKSRDI